MKHKTNLKTVRISMTILLLSVVGIGLIGCNPVTKLYLIDKQDVVDMPKGVSYTPDRDGRFYSLEAEQEVMQVKVENKKK